MMNICINIILICMAVVTLILTVGLIGVILIEIKDYIKEKFF
jgi:hypothetical protein|nr:MAG TPA_asm: hypothetical protein [Caudoviricetes sp.]